MSSKRVRMAKPILDEGAAAAGAGKVSTKLADGKGQIKFLDTSGAFRQQDS
ncbi:hypothetical protein [Christensenella tenuis]|uniref:Uncharacterized protein n=1 Tax=Christensenella tenuis TaxID=2763033 RepID=A0ABR7EEJ8_9FIRM|nr:hypothetical protein [Christensenella tenuis]MBC5648207.1 hypothetical protein [Christensenella tenuis]